MRIFRWIGQLFCQHGVYIDELVGRDQSADGETVRAKCHKCGKWLSADCGLHLNATLDGFNPSGARFTEMRKNDGTSDGFHTR